MARRRAHAEEFAVRVNRAVALLGERSSAAAVAALAAEFRLSERQARRYVQAARGCPESVVVPERTAVFTVRLPASLVTEVRSVAAASGESLSATAAWALHAGLERAERACEGSARGAAPR
jgi:hypothetical protein